MSALESPGAGVRKRVVEEKGPMNGAPASVPAGLAPASGAGMQAQALTLVRRLDIDGLRAVAVLCVLVFHAFPAVLPGGFVGVDVFFVISGYLISGILLRDLDRGTFSFADFYAHRVRRIFPALLLVLVACQLFGTQALFADELAELSRHIAAGAVFSSNLLVLRSQSGYFDRAADLKPLLHLWSLGIEEQFYLFWPLLLWLGFSRVPVGKVMGSLFAASLLYCVMLTVDRPEAAFYSPLSRLWELAMGALLAWVQFRGRAGIPTSFARLAQYAGVVGLALILGAAFLFDGGMAFPGVLALAPTVGAALVIASGPDGGIHRRLLGHPLAVWLGTVSYPLYLWHWPLLAFARQIGAGEPSAALRGGLLLLALLLAWLTYRYVELPLRRDFSLRKVARGAIGLIIFVGTAALVVYRGDGFQDSGFALRSRSFMVENHKLLGWFAPSADCVRDLKLEVESRQAPEAVFCSRSPGGAPTVALLGDSTANALFPGMADIYHARGQFVINIGNGTCAPFRGLKGGFQWNTVCEAVNEKVYGYVLSHQEIKTVILSMTAWDIIHMDMPGLPASPSLGQRFAAIRPLVERDVNVLLAGGKRVVVTFDSPHLDVGPGHCVREPGNCVSKGKTAKVWLDPYLGDWKKLFAPFSGVCVFEQTPFFRLPGGDYRVTKDNLILFRDGHHLSRYGSVEVARFFAASPCFVDP